MLPRERVLAALNHKEGDRIPYSDNPWFTTLERWISEGYPEGVEPDDYFEFEIIQFHPDSSFLLAENIIEETDEYKIYYDCNGALRKDWKHRTSTPELINFSLTSRKKWEKLKERLEFKAERINFKKDKPRLERAKKKGKYILFGAGAGYDWFSSVVGPMTLLPALLTDPDWVYDMFKCHTELIINLAEEMYGMGYDFDGAFICDDLGYKNGVFFSKDVYRELLQPHHKRLCDFFHGRGGKVILHSCGNVIEHIPALIESGFDCLQALEVKAGMDLLELKRDFGEKLAFMGGIDVRKMSDPDPTVIEEEIRTKITAAKKGGGYIYHSDHSIPDNVSFDQFKRVLELVKKYGRY
jgi:uroporphyrinogen decarboxylase